MKDIPRLISMLADNNPNKRYDACEYLRVYPHQLPQEALDALLLATSDHNTDVADAARRALALHTPIKQSNAGANSSAETYTEPPSLEKQPASTHCIEILFYIVIGCILGGVIGNYIGSWVDSGWMAPWYLLGTPSEPAQKIIAIDFSSIEIESASGQHYIFQTDTESFNGKPPTGQFVKSDTPLKIWYGSQCTIDASYASPPPSPAIDIANGNYCGEVSFHVIYAILENGSVWRWSTPGGYSPLVYGFFGIVIGFLASIIMTIIKVDIF